MSLLKRTATRLWSRKVEMGLGVRVTAAAFTALALAITLHLRLPLWAVLTAIIVTQMSVGRSLKVTREYLIGTIGGAIYGGAIAILIPHHGESALLAVLVLAVAPLAFLAAINPSLNVATVTAIIVLLLPTMGQMSPLESAIDRILEVTVGAVTGLLVSFLVLPSRAYGQIRVNAARVLNLLADAVQELLAGLTRGRDNDALHALQDGIGHAISELNAIGTEAERERAAWLSHGPDTGPLLRTVLRLRHDVVMIGRATVTPLPANLQSRLMLPIAQLSEAISNYLKASAEALRQGAAVPAIGPVQTALLAYAEEIAAMRREGLTRGLPGDMTERFFALGFSLEQMRQNLVDLERCISEWVGGPDPSASKDAAGTS
ncbi:FUSC family protein [Nitrobacter sp.]|uniref:FUSC family protein n=1 Tax=Nitrobacter sp. TaxID=29420 RepID=UPI0039B644A9